MNDGVVQLQAAGNDGVVRLPSTMVWYSVVRLHATTVWCSYRQQWCGTATFNNGVVHSWGYVYLQWRGTRLGLRLLM